MAKYKIVHYINQFAAGIGGEEQAGIAPQKQAGKMGAGALIEKGFEGEAEVVATVICGDSYFNENLEKAKAEVLALIKEEQPDLLIAGPAFNAGRYGTACGTVAKLVQDELKIPVVSGMYIENPGVDLFKESIYIVATKDNAAGMREAMPAIVKLAKKLVKKEMIGSASEEGYIERGGARQPIFAQEIGAKRAVDMLVKKLTKQPFGSEYLMPAFDRVPIAPAIKDISKAKIAVVTSGGIVPKGNPDHIEASSAQKYGRYPITEMAETAHGGYDPTYANANPNRVLPIDVLIDLKNEGKIGDLYPYYYTTVGNGTSVKSSVEYAKEIAAELIKDKVDAVILTST